MKRTLILFFLLLLLVPIFIRSTVFGQSNYDNYIVFNRGLPLAEVAEEVKVSSGSSVWIIDPADTLTSLTRVTPEETGSSLMPSWGPGKTHIVFASNRLNQGDTPLLDIWTIRTDGSDLSRLTQNAGHNWTPAWSADGSKIAFASTRKTPTDPDPVWHFDIFVMNADGSDQQFLANVGGQDEDPVFSANGEVVYFIAEKLEACFQIWQVATSGGSANPLRDNNNNIVCGEDISLSPDGKTLFFWSNATGQFAGFDLETRQITYYSWDAFEPWISPSGNQFTFMSDCDDSYNCNIFISDLEGNNLMRVTSGRQDFFPRWASPAVISNVEQLPTGQFSKEFRLEQNYPNPFNSTTAIHFVLVERAEVKLKIFDILGKEVVTMVDEELLPGKHKMIFEAENLPAGIYLFQFQANRSTRTKKLMLLK